MIPNSLTAPCSQRESRPWPVQVFGQAYGVRLGLRTNHSDVLNRLAPLLPPGWQEAETASADRLYSLRMGERAGEQHQLFAGRRQLAESACLDYLLDCFETDMQIHLGEMAPWRVFVHAGVVGWRGRAIVLPGRSFAGKSTLVAALLRAGATYYSDEFAVLDAEGMVHPYPRLLSLRRENGQRPLRCSAAELGSQTGTLPLPVGLIVLVCFEPAGRWRPAPLSTGPALLELVGHCVPIRRRPGESLAALQQALAQAVVLHGDRGEAEAMTEELLNRW